LGPALPPKERVSWKQRFLSLRAAVLPIALIIGVLGSIFMGLATVNEAAALGALGSIICAAFYRNLSWSLIKDSLLATTRIWGMALWIVLGASVFSRVYVALGAAELIEETVAGLHLNPWIVLIGMQVTLILLGLFMEEYAIVMVAAPIYLPIIESLGFNPLWFGILFMINMQIAVITPPYGWALFWLKAVVPPDITMGDIWRSITPFVIIQIVVLAIVMAFPQIVLWLPEMMIE
jgi:tripartite ATP-independent transporter DctM subunit